MAGDGVGQSRRIALVGDRRHRDAELVLEQHGVEIRGRAGAGRGIVEPAGLRLGVLDEIGDRLHRQRRVDHQHERHVRHQPDRDEILDRIIGQILEHADVDRHGGRCRHQQRVAVRRRLRRRHGGDDVGAARAVLDHERRLRAAARASAPACATSQSVEPPAGNGTIRVTGRDGIGCAAAPRSPGRGQNSGQQRGRRRASVIANSPQQRVFVADASFCRSLRMDSAAVSAFLDTAALRRHKPLARAVLRLARIDCGP